MSNLLQITQDLPFCTKIGDLAPETKDFKIFLQIH
jgi:hypothetical protein